MKKIASLLLVTFIFLAFHTSYAQDNGKNKGKKHNKSAFKKEIKEYMKQNVLPVLREQRAKLEKDISATDKTQINTYRAELKKNYSLIKKGNKKKKEAKKAGNEISDAEKEAIWIAQGQNKELLGKARELSKTYKDKIETLLDEISDKQVKWESDLKAIHEKKNEKRVANGKGKNKRGNKANKIKRAKPVRFLLLDPNGTDDDLDGVFDDGND
jgi:hypothetical protein